MTVLSIGAALKALEARLARHGIGMSHLEARYLMAEAAGLNAQNLTLRADLPLDEAASTRLETLVSRRLAHEPLNRVLGHAEFWGLPLIVTPAVLDPRNDSETLLRAALALLGPRRHQPLRILDLGTGSGALLCALLHECPAATGIAIDLSPAAARIAQRNLTLNHLDQRGAVLVSNWADALEARFDLVVSNPPYIVSADMATLEPSVRNFDPPLALDGGSDGLNAYRALARQLPRLLRPDGWAILEAGAGQADAIAALLAAAGLVDPRRWSDYGGHERAICARSANEGE